MPYEFYQNPSAGQSLADNYVFAKMKTKRSNSYTVTSGDVAAKYTGAISINWATPFADTNYTVSLAVEGVTLASATKDGYAVGHFTKTATGLTVYLSVPTGTAGDVVGVSALAIHD